jgi:formylglycine-generating enzyme required for sulfatase activity/dienelactone hydrolase
MAVLLAVLALGGLYVVHERRVRWAREEAIPQIQQLIAEDNYLAAFDLARGAEKRIPNDAGLMALWPQMSRTIAIDTDPPGAEVFFKKYAAPETEWRRLGITPLSNITIPQGFYEWKASKAGHEEFHGAAPTLAERARFQLPPKGSVPPGMIKVQGGPFLLSIAAFGPIGPFSLTDFFIDRYEVTNREFKQFVNRGGYQSGQYWKEAFRKDGRTLSWEEAMSEFHDATGRPGPAAWEGGSYREGEEDFPVTGVSWYEAAAYAEFAGKKLPTVPHWFRAAGVGVAPYMVPASNFGNKGLARSGQYAGISAAGAYDMAGNAREWCSNQAGAGLRFTLGGAWSDPPYQFTDPDARSPFDRFPTNGFRCVRYISPPAAGAAGPMRKSFRDFSKEKPVSDELFRAYTSLYSFAPSDLKAAVDSVNDSSPYWKIEKVSFQAAYGNQRMFAYLFLPKGASPPYHPMVYFPGIWALYARSSTVIAQGKGIDMRGLDFVIRSGRAVIYPIYQGSFERSLPGPYPEVLLQKRERYVQWSQDVHRSVDYLATRPDMDLSQLAYYGESLGGYITAILVPLEPRFKLAVLLDAGLSSRPNLPESDAINFVSRFKIPVLMVNGRSDFTFPMETSQAPMFRMLGTSEKDKRHVVLDGAHGVLSYHRNEVVREVLAWFDKYAPIGRK